MKKTIALVLVLVLSFAMMVPTNAATSDTYMIFAGETDDGCGIHISGFGRLWGPVGENESLGHPAPVQGEKSYCVNTDTAQTVLYHNVNWNYPATTTGIFDATGYDYIELDVYCSADILCDWEFGLCTSEDDPAGAAWGAQSVVIPGRRWTHVKMPISEFGSFPAAYPGSMNNIRRIKMQLTNIVDRYKMYEGTTEPPIYTYVYFDNIVATKNGAGRDTELLSHDTVLLDPPAWFVEYEENYVPVDPPAPPEVVYGDVDGDDEITAQDALQALLHTVKKITLDNFAFECADVDGNRTIDAQDALSILQYVVKKIDVWPKDAVGA